ncbi:MAG: hypothetical protein ACLP8S_26810 [Solirubrobacteraceae bacterium]
MPARPVCGGGGPRRTTGRGTVKSSAGALYAFAISYGPTLGVISL